VHQVLGPEAEAGLVTLARGLRPEAPGAGLPRLDFIQPDRSGLSPLASYASLQMPDGSRRVVGSTDATRGCKHLCRHCPIVPVYRGQFRAIPVDVVMGDVAAQVAAGAQHISFGDPDFFNGPSHARRIVERLAGEHPGITYDATIKVEHLLKHADLLPVLRDTGCLFVTSAVESVDDAVLAKLAKGHTRRDFVRVVDACRAAGLTLSPTFVPFTPWTTVDGYVDLLETLESLDLVEHVAPIQLAIRLLVTAGSPLLELSEIASRVDPFDHQTLTWPWRHDDPRVDRLQEDLMRLVGVRIAGSRGATFDAAMALARSAAGGSPRHSSRPSRNRATVPYLNEPWYC
jgi:Radical SAM superfamily